MQQRGLKIVKQIGIVKSELMAAATKKKQKDFETKMRLLLGGGYY